MAISKKLRFEVLKRDKFTCQYCHAKDDDVILEIDHIEPVSKGGSDHILNLVTACRDCNRGKSDRLLSDDSVIEKQRKQLEEAQARREQLELKIAWQRELMDMDNSILGQVESYWNELAPGWVLSPQGRQSLRKLLKKFDVEETMIAMKTSASHYLIFDADGCATRESWQEAFKKVGAIATITRQEKSNPHLKDIYYIRAIVRNRMKQCGEEMDERRAIILIKEAVAVGVTIPSLKEDAKRAERFSWWAQGVGGMIDVQREEGGVFVLKIEGLRPVFENDAHAGYEAADG